MSSSKSNRNKYIQKVAIEIKLSDRYLRVSQGLAVAPYKIVNN